MTQTTIPESLFVARSQTSRAAAEAIRPDTGRLRLAVLVAIRDAGGLTDEEGIDATGISPNCYRPRRVELVQMGKVIDSGKTRLTKSLRKAVVWVAT